MRAFAIVVITIGCSKGATSHSNGSAGSSTPIVATPSADAVVAPPVDASVLGDLPAFTLALPASRADIEAGEKLNNEGYAFHVKKDWPNAFAKYGDALKKDPGNLLARYNLASAYHSSGDDVKAVALLAQFKQASCRACDAILLHSKTDSEWKSLQGDAAYKAITDGIVAEKVDLKKIAAAVSKAIATKKLDEILPYIHPHAATKEREEEGPPTGWNVHYGVDEFQAFVNAVSKDYYDNGLREGQACEKQGALMCCNGGTRGDTGFTMADVCFSMIGGVPFIAQIELDPGI